MKNKNYSIFGAGAAGLYTAWRLLSGKTKTAAGKAKLLTSGDTLNLYDWGKYDLESKFEDPRAAGARICTWHYNGDKDNSYLEMGGMRYSYWDSTLKNQATAQGHRLVTKVIQEMDLEKYSVPFNETSNELYYLRSKNMLLDNISTTSPAPYNANNYAAASPPDNAFGVLGDLAVTPTYPQTRREWCEFYQKGCISVDLPESSVFQKGDRLRDIGYWNLMYDQLGSEGFDYTADGNGYTSNIINWNSAVAFNTNNEFTPGNQYKTLTQGYSSMFNALFDRVKKLAAEKKVKFTYHPNTRLHSILHVDGEVHYRTATRANPNKAAESLTADAAWLAMPRNAIELVAQATRYQAHQGTDVLNDPKVQLFLESATMQPSYKVGMFFDTDWWNSAPYAPQLTGYVVTEEVLAQLKGKLFDEAAIERLRNGQLNKTTPFLGCPFDSAATFVKEVEKLLQQRLSVPQEEKLLAAALRNTIGPTITDTPVRMVVYFGDNAIKKQEKPVYGILASYDDEQFTSFWQELELKNGVDRTLPISDDLQPLDGPRDAPEVMVNMLRQQLAQIHFGPQADYTMVPKPLATTYMDWSLPPFNAGYHAWAAHFDIGEVQTKIRKPSQLLKGVDANIFIVGETYSNDQAWVEGAYCTAESVLNDFFDIEPIIDTKHYPFICPFNEKDK